MAQQNRVALITGASRGIGRGIALALAGAGYDVAVNYAGNAAAAAEVVEKIRSTGARAEPLQADISIAADRARLVQNTLDAFRRIDLLVNNAGVAPNVRADLLQASEESYDRVMGINLKGPYFLTQLAARQMLEQPNDPAAMPKIINITSVSSYAVSVNRGDYCLAKAALGMMTQLFAVRLAGHGIGVYEVRPGVIETDMTGPVREKYDKLIFEDGLTPIRRWGTPDDVAKAVVAIASGAFPYSTGDIINVDGGFHLRRL
jgi:NAD(P)-dependent dehydrogenase (short-subunit alcohol dehydrogenase family)